MPDFIENFGDALKNSKWLEAAAFGVGTIGDLYFKNKAAKQAEDNLNWTKNIYAQNEASKLAAGKASSDAFTNIFSSKSKEEEKKKNGLIKPLGLGSTTTPTIGV
jgi:hypothetical protein